MRPANSGGRAVASHEHGTAWRGFPPRGWDQLVASYAPGGSCEGLDRLNGSVLALDRCRAVGAHGVPGGVRNRDRKVLRLWLRGEGLRQRRRA